MKLTEEIASDLRAGAIFYVEGERIGVRRVRRIWFNPATSHYVADVGWLYMWTDSLSNPWQIVPAVPHGE